MNEIVVGVDGSESAQAALRFAIEEARLRGASVRAVAVWHLAAAAYGGGFDPGLVADLGPRTEQVLENALERAADHAAGVDVEPVVREGPPARVLLDEAGEAAMLVLGSRGLGGFRGLLLGSVGQQCAHHAPCPVVIVPHARDLPPDP